LVATLEEGQSIPISSDIPDDIRPIGRMRIVVGDQPLPRTQLTTVLKPWPEALEKQSRDGVIETQYTVPPVERSTPDRYANAQSQAILPPNDAPPSVSQQLAQAVQNQGSQILPPQDSPGLVGAVQGATQQLGNQLRNVGESVRTDAQQMFGNAGDINPPGFLGQVGDTVGRVQQGIQQGVEPFRQAAEQTGQQLRNAAEGIGQRTREVVDQFGRPLGQQSILSSGSNDSQSILPPDSAAAGQQLVGDQNTQRGRRLDQPVGSNLQNDWQTPAWNDPQAILPGDNPQSSVGQNSSFSPSSDSTPGNFDAPWPILPREEYQNQASQQNQAIQTWPNNPQNDRYDLANHPTLGASPTSSDDRYNNSSNDQWPTGPSFPANEGNPSPALASSGQGNQPATQGNGAPWPVGNSSAPEIRSEMLDQPIDSDLQTVGTQPASQASSGAPTSNQPTRASDFGWDTSSMQSNSPSNNGTNSPTNVFPLVLSWVLLSGSGAGNLYLLWSFWDVRNKYRGLVHNARGSNRYAGS
ncbi:MAG: hypothetical protein KDA57_17030, partial [Planctomycetales bacterium]|nr:hypothetical protein [Planctomycetales bacterium]